LHAVLTRVHDKLTSFFKLEAQRCPEAECSDVRLDAPLERIDGNAEVRCAAARATELAETWRMLASANGAARQRAAGRLRVHAADFLGKSGETERARGAVVAIGDETVNSPHT